MALTRRNRNRYVLVLQGAELQSAITGGDVIEVIEVQNEEVGGVGEDSVMPLPEV
jgi:hypothetical protein